MTEVHKRRTIRNISTREEKQVGDKINVMGNGWCQIIKKTKRKKHTRFQPDIDKGWYEYNYWATQL